MSGYTGTQAELLYTLPAVVTKNTYTAEAAYSGVLGTNTVCSIPPGYFAMDNPYPVGRALHLKAMGTIANTAAATFAVNLGLDPTAGTKANAVAMHTALTPTAAVTATWMLEAWYTCTAYATSTVSLQVNGTFRYESVASGGAGGTGAQTGGFSGALTGVDPRVQLYIELFGTWSASNAANTTSLQQMLLFGLN